MILWTLMLPELPTILVGEDLMDSVDSEEDEVVEGEVVEDAAGPQVQIFFVNGDEKENFWRLWNFFFVLKNFKQNLTVKCFIFSLFELNFQADYFIIPCLQNRAYKGSVTLRIALGLKKLGFYKKKPQPIGFFWFCWVFGLFWMFQFKSI